MIVKGLIVVYNTYSLYYSSILIKRRLSEPNLVLKKINHYKNFNMRTLIKLKIYRVTLFFLFKIIHTEIEVMGSDIWFDPEGVKILPAQNKTNTDSDYELIEIIHCGWVKLTAKKLREILNKIKTSTGKYDLIFNNCRHFSQDFLLSLNPSRINNGLKPLYKLTWGKMGIILRCLEPLLKPIIRDFGKLISVYAVIFGRLCFTNGFEEAVNMTQSLFGIFLESFRCK